MRQMFPPAHLGCQEEDGRIACAGYATTYVGACASGNRFVFRKKNVKRKKRSIKEIVALSLPRLSEEEVQGARGRGWKRLEAEMETHDLSLRWLYGDGWSVPRLDDGDFWIVRRSECGRRTRDAGGAAAHDRKTAAARTCSWIPASIVWRPKVFWNPTKPVILAQALSPEGIWKPSGGTGIRRKAQPGQLWRKISATRRNRPAPARIGSAAGVLRNCARAKVGRVAAQANRAGDLGKPRGEKSERAGAKPNHSGNFARTRGGMTLRAFARSVRRGDGRKTRAAEAKHPGARPQRRR
jgi:hypothetical protein